MGPAHPLWSKHTNENRARIPMLKELGQNSNVYKKATEFKCFEESDQNSNLYKYGHNSHGWNGKIRKPVYRKLGPEYQLLEG